jgi:hypothetical protein
MMVLWKIVDKKMMVEVEEGGGGLNGCVGF